MSEQRCLTKSRFKLGSECPTKLFYTRKSEYADQKDSDSFLAALAEGGYQVGELAKQYFPSEHDIKTLKYEESLAQTNELMQRENVIIHEAAFRHENLFIRADMIVKKSNCIDLIEVKAKSCDPSDLPFEKKRVEWKPYLEDVAFQKYVMNRALPGYQISAYLMLADKTASCPTDGLNQKFVITEQEDGDKEVKVSGPITEEDLNPRLLCQIPVDDYCERIYESDGTGELLGLS